MRISDWSSDVCSSDLRKSRKAFVAEEGFVLLSVDYSQIELRLTAHIAEVPALKQAFHEGQDIHAITAAQVFGIPVEGMDPMVRRKAKAINFGIIYGISAFGLAQNLAIPQGEARAYRSEEHTSELQSLMRISYAVFCLKKKKTERSL